LVQTLTKWKVEPESIGVLSPFRGQVSLITRKLSEFRVEISTVDKYQGKDKNCIILSMVKSNPESQVGDLLQDSRRLNVAFTRAKKKLIVVGNRMTLNQAQDMNKFLALCEKKSWVVQIPK
jgi:DNA replication ATP-dependent helicase Dna2